MGLEKIFISLLAKEVLHKNIGEEAIKKELTEKPDMIKALYTLSKMHDLSHIICLGLKNIGVWGKGEIFEKFLDDQSLAVYRYEQQKYEYEKICRVFEEKKISYMPLKGVCIRHLYPEVWMRTSSDIDILVKKEDIQVVRELMVDRCNFEEVEEDKTTVSFHSRNGVCVEIHRLIDTDNNHEIPLDVWERSYTVPNSTKHVMPMEMFYYHIVAHLIKHLFLYGCGIKPFLDLYLLDKYGEVDKDKALKLLKTYNIDIAEKALVKTLRVWFENEESDELSNMIKKRVLLSGSYGNKVTSRGTRHKRKGGKFRYVLWLILPDRTEMERRYPILKEQPEKLVIYHFKRWGHLIFKGRIRSSAKIIGKNLSAPKQEIDQITFMMKQMGLQ